MQGTPKEVPRRRQTRAFTKVGDLLSKPSKAMGATTSINLNLVGHSMVCKKFAKIFLHPVRSFFQVFWKEAFRMRFEATELNATSHVRQATPGGRKTSAHIIDAFSASRHYVRMYF